jgi:hypothetical protein
VFVGKGLGNGPGRQENALRLRPLRHRIVDSQSQQAAEHQEPAPAIASPEQIGRFCADVLLPSATSTASRGGTVLRHTLGGSAANAASGDSTTCTPRSRVADPRQAPAQATGEMCFRARRALEMGLNVESPISYRPRAAAVPGATSSAFGDPARAASHDSVADLGFTWRGAVRRPPQWPNYSDSPVASRAILRSRKSSCRTTSPCRRVNS